MEVTTSCNTSCLDELKYSSLALEVLKLESLGNKSLLLYDQRILENRNGDLDQKVWSAKGEEKVQK